MTKLRLLAGIALLQMVLPCGAVIAPASMEIAADAASPLSAVFVSSMAQSTCEAMPCINTYLPPTRPAVLPKNDLPWFYEAPENESTDEAPTLEQVDALSMPFSIVNSRPLDMPVMNGQSGLRNVFHDSTLADNSEIMLLQQTNRVGTSALVPGPFHNSFTYHETPSRSLVARFRQQDRGMILGSYVSQRSSREGSNLVLGGDAGVQISPQERLTLQMAVSTTSGWAQPEPDALPRLAQQQGLAWFMGWGHAGPAWQFDVNLQAISRHFRADNGLINQAGYRATGFRIGRKLPLPLFEDVQIHLATERVIADDGSLVSASIRPGLTWVLPADSVITFELRPQQRLRVAEDVALSRYRDMHLEMRTSLAAFIPQVGCTYDWGQQVNTFDGTLGRGASSSAYAVLALHDRLHVQTVYSRSTLRQQEAGLEAGPATLLQNSTHETALDWQLSERQQINLRYQQIKVNGLALAGQLVEAQQIKRWSASYSWQSSRKTRLSVGISQFGDDEMFGIDTSAKQPSRVFLSWSARL